MISSGVMISSDAEAFGASGTSTFTNCIKSNATEVQPIIYKNTFTPYFAFPVAVHCPVAKHAGQNPTNPAIRGRRPR